MYKTSAKNSSRVTFANAMAGRGKKELEFPGLSKKLVNAFKADNFVEGAIVKVVKGGFLVSFLGCRALCPFSEFPSNVPHTEIAEHLRTGLPLKFKIIKLEDSRSVIVSRKKAIADDGLNRAHRYMKRGSLLDGIVKDVVPYGALVNIGGFDALLHRSKIPTSISLKKGDRIRIKVIAIDGKKISVDFA